LFVTSSRRDFLTKAKAEQNMDMVKTFVSRVSHHHCLSLGFLMPITRALQKPLSPHCCFPDPFTICPVHLLLLQARDLPPGVVQVAQSLPGVVPAGTQAWQATHSWCLPAGRDAAEQLLLQNRKVGPEKPAFPQGRSSNSPCCLVLGDGSEGKEETAIPVHVPY